MSRISKILLLFFLITSCVPEPKPGNDFDFPLLMEIPSHFPDINFPEDNEFDEKKWVIGKRLFYDPIMSVDSTISCASCHDQSLAFADDKAFSLGVKDRLGTRNAPSLSNVAYHPYYTMEGGLATLEMQILVPLQEHNEFDFNIVLLAERLSDHPVYRDAIVDAFDREPDAYTITRAITNFERSLISGSSPYDAYILGDESALSDEELNGMDLFFSDKTKCSTCHSGFNFTNYAFENNGLYESYEDIGRKRLTGLDEDLSKFKTPSLRNIGLTAPYMHNGSKQTLESIVEHYMSGGAAHPNKNEAVQGFQLTDEEKNNLVAFLNSLTDLNFTNNNIFK